MGKKYDAVVFGATGFTGQFVVEEFARTLGEEKSAITWAVAGRNMKKLQQVLEQASQKTGKDLKELPILIADVSSESSLQEMCSAATLILDCVGPYRLYGEAVVKACIENKTHYIDISGEPGYLERIQLDYHSKAQEAGIYILGACGFDSIPSEMALVHMQKEFKGDLNNVEAFLDIKFGPSGGHINFATLHSAILSFSNAKELRNLRKQLMPDRPPRSVHKPPKRGTVFQTKEIEGWCLPFVGADRSVVQRTQYYEYHVNKERTYEFNMYTVVPSLLSVAHSIMFGIIFGLLSKFSLGRTLLLKFPWFLSLGMFDFNGPTRKQMEEASFELTLVGEGYTTKLTDPAEQHPNKPDAKIITKLVAPEMGYVTTPICMVQAAYVLLHEQNTLPTGGGVYPPGAAFVRTSLLERLQKHNIKFTVVQ